MSQLLACAPLQPLTLLSDLSPSGGSEGSVISFDQTRSFSATAAEEELERICEEASKPDWDCQGSAPVSDSTARWAHRFLKSIPTTFPAPELSADVDGEILFDWYEDPNWVLQVSINENGLASYARRFGADAQQGEAWFDARLPADIERNLVSFVVRL